MSRSPAAGGRHGWTPAGNSGGGRTGRSCPRWTSPPMPRGSTAPVHSGMCAS